MGIRDGVVLSATTFLLGALFTASLVDGPVLWTTGEHLQDFAAAERYYLSWWYAPLAVKALLHSIVSILIITLCFKLAVWNDLAFFFDGGSLALTILTFAFYSAVTIPCIRTLVSERLDSSYNSSFPLLVNPPDSATQYSTGTPLGLFHTIWDFLTNISPPKSTIVEDLPLVEPLDLEKKKENIAVLCAGNLIMVCLLVGVLVLQIGQVWAAEYIVKPELERQKKVDEERKSEVEKKRKETKKNK